MPLKTNMMSAGQPLTAECHNGLDLPRRIPVVSHFGTGATKVWFDRIVAIVLLIPALPLLTILWLLVKVTSRGPGLYCQRRLGLSGREFHIYKLRTMQHNCEVHTGAVWAQPQDPRTTTLGKFLRATHLDELPQLFNVLRGEMSLVGPRPERPEIIEKLIPEIPDYVDRLHVRPGVTGLAQICARPDLNLEDVRHKLNYDLTYIQCMSAWLDLRILCCTAFKMLGLNRAWFRAALLGPLSTPIKPDGPVS